MLFRSKLRYLQLFDHPKLASLPVGLQQATSLRHLQIWDCPNLTTLPALTSLKTLDIWRCPILVESCKSQDWVARIENLRGDLAPPKEEDPGIEFHYAKQNSSSPSLIV